MSTNQTEVRLTIKRISPLVWAHASGLIKGNRKARRQAAAQARKGVVGVPPGWIDTRGVPHYPDPILQAAGYPDIITEVARLPDPIVDAARDCRISEMVSNAQHTMDWMRVQALQGRIIDTLSPEERAARDAAAAAESDRAEAEYASMGTDLPAVGSFHG